MMKIKDGFILREVAGSFVVVAVGKRATEFNGVINLNETSAFMWRMLEKGATNEEIVTEMSKEYDAPIDVLERDVKSFTQKLKEAGLTE
jgi:hypothetical protein